jgi:pimeloyl-ACP methyl ester carboxylesterase
VSDDAAEGLTPRDLVVDGVRLEAFWIGPAPCDAPTAVFLHQGLGSARLWGEFAVQLCASIGCGGLVYSRRGYGSSDPLERSLAPSFMHEEALEVLPAILSTFGIADPIFIGHSDGASIATIYAGAGNPVRALVLEAPHVFVEDLAIEGIVDGKRRYETEDFRSRLERHHGSNTDGTFRAWSDVWLSEAFRAWNVESYVRGITCPVLVVQGDADAFGTLAQVEAIGRLASGPVTTLVIPDCGHSPHRSHAEIVLNSSSSFLLRSLKLSISPRQTETRT